MKYKNFLIRLFDLILVLGLLAGYQAVIYSRDKEATIAELKISFKEKRRIFLKQQKILESWEKVVHLPVRQERIKMERILEVRRDLAEKLK